MLVGGRVISFSGILPCVSHPHTWNFTQAELRPGTGHAACAQRRRKPGPEGPEPESSLREPNGYEAKWVSLHFQGKQKQWFPFGFAAKTGILLGLLLKNQPKAGSLQKHTRTQRQVWTYMAFFPDKVFCFLKQIPLPPARRSCQLVSSRGGCIPATTVSFHCFKIGKLCLCWKQKSSPCGLCASVLLVSGIHRNQPQFLKSAACFGDHCSMLRGPLQHINGVIGANLCIKHV